MKHKHYEVLVRWLADQALDSMVRIKQGLMRQRRFGTDSINGWRSAATQAEGDVEELLIELRAALAQEPAQPDRSAELKSWSLLAARALDDCHRVIETIVAESTTEEEKLDELDKRVYELFNQALCLHGVMTRSQLDKATGFGRVDVTGPIDGPAQPAVQEPVDQLGIPLSCGKPLCSPGNHHQLCHLAVQEPAPQSKRLTDEQMEALLPVIHMKGEAPKRAVWLTRDDALQFGRQVEAVVLGEKP